MIAYIQVTVDVQLPISPAITEAQAKELIRAHIEKSFATGLWPTLAVKATRVEIVESE
jgi:hypothetical protein